MKLLTHMRIGLFITAVLGFGAAGVLADLLNASFESPAEPDNSVNTGVAPTSWTVENPRSMSLINQMLTQAWGPSIPDQEQIVSLNWVDPPLVPAIIWQNTGLVMHTGMTYTLSVWHKAYYTPGQTGGSNTLFMYIYGATNNTSKGTQLASLIAQHPGYRILLDDNVTYYYYPWYGNNPSIGVQYILNYTCDSANNGKYLTVLFGNSNLRNHCYLDAVTLTRSLVTLNATINPSDYTGDRSDVSVEVELRQGGTAVRTERVFLNSSGVFSLPRVVPGVYDIAVKGNSWLRKVTNVDINSDPTSVTINLNNGDVNGGNVIDSTDLSIVTANMNRVGDP